MDYKRIGYLFFLIHIWCFRLSAQMPVQNEPHHRVVLENKYIRVLDGQILGHDTTISHRHAATSLVVFLTKSTFGIQIEGEPSIITDVNPGDLKYVDYGEKPVIHRVWNQSLSLFHFLVVEITKKPRDDESCSILSNAFLKLQSVQKSYRTYYADIEKSKKCHIPKSDCAHLLIDLSGRVTTASSGKISSLQTDTFAFFPPNSEIEITTANNENARCVLVEVN